MSYWEHLSGFKADKRQRYTRSVLDIAVALAYSEIDKQSAKYGEVGESDFAVLKALNKAVIPHSELGGYQIRVTNIQDDIADLVKDAKTLHKYKIAKIPYGWGEGYALFVEGIPKKHQKNKKVSASLMTPPNECDITSTTRGTND